MKRSERRAKKKGRGKGKGSAFERKICKQLSLWITNGQKEDCLWRSAISGGRATVAHRKGMIVRQAGDICAVSPEGHALTDRWFIECKHVKNLDLGTFLVSRKGLLAKFWKKARKEAKRYDRLPVIIARQNRWPTLLIGKRTTIQQVQHAAIPLFEDRYGTAAWIFDEVLEERFNG